MDERRRWIARGRCPRALWGGRLALALGLLGLLAFSAHAKKPKRGRLAMVINYPYQITGSGKTKIHATFFLPDFKPAAGAVAKVNGKKVCEADKHGTCIFDYTPGANKGHKLVATAKSGGKTYRVSKQFKSNARTKSFRSDQLFIYTDRGVYNPGDTIHIRALAWELLGVYKALPGAELTVLLQSPEGRVFGGEKIKTDADGVAALDIPLPEGMPLGAYELKILYKKAAEKARLRVERFQPPVMRIKHDLKRFLTPKQSSLAVAVDLSYFAGGIPDEATLKLTAQAPGGPALLERAFEAKGAGAYALTLDKKDLDTIRAGLQAEQPFQLKLAAQDAFGRASEVKRDVVYTQKPYRAVLECDKDDYPTGETVVLTARVVDLDGRPARGIDVRMKLEGASTTAEAKTDDSGVAELRFVMGKQARQAVVHTPLMSQPLGRRQIRLNRPKPMTSKVKDPPQKEGISTYIDVTFHPDYAPVERVIHVDLTDNSGGLVASTTLPITQRADGSWAAGGAVKADTWGTMLANLYVVATRKEHLGKPLDTDKVGLITEGQHVTLLPGQSTHITIRDLKPKVRPGEELDVVVEVKTRGGGEAALGASMVDKAVISLMDPLEVPPHGHFYNPQRKVISTGGAGVLTWPVVDRNWGSPWRDIAYSNWGFKGPGGWVSGGDQGGEGGLGLSGAGKGGGGMGLAKKKPKKMKMLLNAPSPAPEPMMDMAPPPPPMAPAAMAEAEEIADGDMEGEPPMDKPRPRRDGAQAKAPKAPKQITIRTEFPETALWSPKLRTQGGVAKMRLRIPDSITIQELSLVASDQAGGVALLRQPITVHQDVFVRLSPPATMVMGDKVELQALARNHSKAPIEGALRFSSEDLTLVEGAAEIPIKIAPGEAAPAVWIVTPKRAGEARATVKLTSEAVEDSETRATFVLPAGAPTITRVDGALKKGAAFEGALEIHADAAHRLATLNVSFPNTIPALQGWEAAAEAPFAWIGVTGASSQAIMDAALLEWGVKAKKDEAWRAWMRGRLTRAGIALSASQRPDGSWSWWYLADAAHPGGQRGSTYMTAQALRALLAIRAAGQIVDDGVIHKAKKWLYTQRNEAGIWSTGPAYFWEVNAPEADWGLSAELFALLVEAEWATGGEPSADLRGLKGKLEGHLEANGAVDPGALAWGIKGLMRWSKWQKKDKAARKLIKAQLKRLLAAKRGDHWEPHWYHAYGGMVELNALILELLAERDARRHAGTIREILTWLLSTREAWGAWHNEVGTATAVRALLRAGAGAAKEIPSVVVVTVNGAQVKRVDIDPKDPFLSAAGLRRLEITEHLEPGQNTIKVTYDGALEAPASLELREWRGAKPAQGAFKIKRRAPATARVNAPVEITLEIAADKKAPYVQIIDGVPANAAPDTASLDALVKSGAIQGYEIGRGELILLVEALEGRKTLKYTLIAQRPGAAKHPGARVSTRFHPAFGRAAVVGEALTVTER